MLACAVCTPDLPRQSQVDRSPFNKCKKQFCANAYTPELPPSVLHLLVHASRRNSASLDISHLRCLHRVLVLKVFDRRAQDVRAAEIDKVEIAACFRPGDIVRAEVG